MLLLPLVSCLAQYKHSHASLLSRPTTTGHLLHTHTQKHRHLLDIPCILLLPCWQPKAAHTQRPKVVPATTRALVLFPPPPHSNTRHSTHHTPHSHLHQTLLQSPPVTHTTTKVTHQPTQYCPAQCHVGADGLWVRKRKRREKAGDEKRSKAMAAERKAVS